MQHSADRTPPGPAPSIGGREFLRRKEGRSPLLQEYVDEPHRGDHFCYIYDLRKLKAHFPGWEASLSQRGILSEIRDGWATSSRGTPDFEVKDRLDRDRDAPVGGGLAR